MNSILPWIILFAPLASAVIITLFTQRMRRLSRALSILAALVSCGAAWMAFGLPDSSAQVSWLKVGTFEVAIGWRLDWLARTMMIVVTNVGALIHIYSVGYMRDDDGQPRYFAGLSLFLFSMLGIVFADNFVMMFVFWELVGVSSYILIGHWFHKPAAAEAAKKAFLTNRVGDFGFMAGILMVWLTTGAVGFQAVRDGVGALEQSGLMTLAVFGVFCGAVGKSAQFPLHVWLPDAMEGPTPVSALIHAATMVAAGVFMLVRVLFLVEAAPAVAEVIAWTGCVTALLAALMATQQNDIKRILAYSTLSQLGYMVMAVGLLAGQAAMFHLFTHAFFKALLFLAAGSVIVGLHHEQDIWKMGGLRGRMPLTFLTFAVGTLALTGCPGFSGFFSKDMILLAAHGKSAPLFWLALATAFLTAFYMTRLVVVAFLGTPREAAAGHAHESPPVMTVPLLLLAAGSVVAGFGFVTQHFFAFGEEPAHGVLVPALAVGMFVLGTVAAFLLYRGRARDPLYVPLLANKFYVDEFYGLVIRFSQDLLARAGDCFDRWVLDGVAVKGASYGVYGLGFLLRCLQIGNVQAYAFLFGLGAVALLCYVIFQ